MKDLSQRPLLLHGRGDARFDFIVRGESFDALVVSDSTIRGTIRTIRLPNSMLLLDEKVILAARAVSVTQRVELLVAGVSNHRWTSS